MLKEYIKKQGIKSGSIFVSKSVRPPYSSNIWKMLKKYAKWPEWVKTRYFRTISDIFICNDILLIAKVHWSDRGTVLSSCLDFFNSIFTYSCNSAYLSD